MAISTIGVHTDKVTLDNGGGIITLLFMILVWIGECALFVFYARFEKKSTYVYLLMSLSLTRVIDLPVYIAYVFSDFETPYLAYSLSVFGVIAVACEMFAETLILKIFIHGSGGAVTKATIRYYQYFLGVGCLVGTGMVIWVIPFIGSPLPEPLASLWWVFAPIIYTVMMVCEFVVTRYVIYRITKLLTPSSGVAVEMEYDKVGLRRLFWTAIMIVIFDVISLSLISLAVVTCDNSLMCPVGIFGVTFLSFHTFGLALFFQASRALKMTKHVVPAPAKQVGGIDKKSTNSLGITHHSNVVG